MALSSWKDLNKQVRVLLLSPWHNGEQTFKQKWDHAVVKVQAAKVTLGSVVL